MIRPGGSAGARRVFEGKPWWVGLVIAASVSCGGGAGSSTPAGSSTSAGAGGAGGGGGHVPTSSAGGGDAATTASTGTGGGSATSTTGSGGSGGAGQGSGGTSQGSGGASPGSGGSGGSDPPLEYGDAMPHVGVQDNPSGHVPEISRIYASDHRLYYCTTNSKVQMADADAPLMPVFAQPLLNGEKRCRTLHVDAAGKRLVVGKVSDGIGPTSLIALFDTSSGSDLVPLATLIFDPSDSPEEIATIAPDTYAVAMHDRVIVLRYDGASGLAEVGGLGGFTNAYGLAAKGDRLYVGDQAEGIVVLDISVPESPMIVGMTLLPGGARSLELADGLLFASSGMSGVTLLDVQDPDVATPISTIAMPGSAEQVSYAGGYLFVAEWQDIRAYDVRHPENPKLVVVETPQTTLEFARVLGVEAVSEGGQIRVWAGEWGTFVHAYEFHPFRIAPDIRVSTQPLQFPKGESEQTFDIHNDGAQDLTTTLAGAGDFTVFPDSVTVPPGESAAVKVTFTPTAPGLRTANLLLSSPDDPDEPLAFVTARAQSPYVGLGEALTASWQFTDINPASATNGQPFTVTDLRAGAKAVLFVYWAAWCEAGDKLLADIQVLADRYEAAGLRVVALHVPQIGNLPPDSLAQIQASVRRGGLTTAVFQDGAAASGTYQVLIQQPGFTQLGSFPLEVLEKEPLGGNPVIVYDAHEHLPQTLEEAVQEALAP